jgi:hypothetical protein
MNSNSNSFPLLIRLINNLLKSGEEGLIIVFNEEYLDYQINIDF